MGVKRTMRFVGGPYAGRTVTLPVPGFRWDGKGCHWRRAPYLVNVWDGQALHCYLTVQNHERSYNWRLVYQEAF